MSRPGTIWVIVDKAAGHPSAAFTVKQEMLEWLGAQNPEFIGQAVIYPYMDDPPDQISGPVRFPERARDVLLGQTS